MAAPIRVEYFTDPYCVWSWALEPTLEALKLAEEDGIALTYRAKPLFADLAKSGKRAEDFAQEWENVGRMKRIQVEPSIWRENPPHSTLPAWHAAKAAGSLGRGAEGRFLEALRPLLMRGGRTADNPDTLHLAAQEAGLDLRSFDEALERDFGEQLAEDARRAAELGVTRTPTLVMSNRRGDKVLVEGIRDLLLLQRAVEALRVEEDLEERAEEAPRLTTTPLMTEAPQEAEQTRER